jgi:hypothetical protein
VSIPQAMKGRHRMAYKRLVVCDPRLAVWLGALPIDRVEASSIVRSGALGLPDPRCFLLVPPGDAYGVFVWRVTAGALNG